MCLPGAPAGIIEGINRFKVQWKRRKEPTLFAASFNECKRRRIALFQRFLH
jgi:hypothetical protein